VEVKDSGKYPIICPRCAAAAGYPYEASTQVGRVDLIRVAVRCRQCHHEWTTEEPMTPALRQDLD
jgi:hypothetical protein